MRYVDIEELRLEGDWLQQARAATKQVLAGTAKASDFDELWRDLKAKLSELLCYKCWFCETPITRSDNAVDHFRPKGRVSDAERDHSGYRWLTFAPANFRYACTFCNSRRIDVEHGTDGGKADRFPLMKEEFRVYAVDAADLDYEDILTTVQNERPELLDPCEIDDWKLLGCKREDGSPCPTSDDADTVRRVGQSIAVYHLHHDPTCKQRHTVAGTLLRTVRAAKKEFLRIDPADPATRSSFNELAKQIQRMVASRAPYSGEMRFLLRGQRASQHPWIQELIEAG